MITSLRRVLIGAIVLAMFAVSYPVGSTSSEPVEMPPLPESRRPTYEFYALQFLPDGYPGRRCQSGNKNCPQGAVPHPLYGAYVMADYTWLYETTRDKKYLDAARKVADAAISRMTRIGNALAFYMTPEMGLEEVPYAFYDALTQARYLEALTNLWRVSGDQKYLAAAADVFNALLIPVEQGGVARRKAGGIILEEWPNPEMGTYILNGWTTAMIMVHRYAKLTGSVEASKLFDANIVTLKALLPLFDMPKFANSRYALTGHSQIKIDLIGTTGKLSKTAIEIPGEGRITTGPYSNDRWANAVKHQDQNGAVLNVVFNYVSYPRDNSLLATLDVEKAGRAIIYVLIDQYHPIESHAINDIGLRWRFVDAVELNAGQNDIAVRIPWSSIPYIGSPTGFDKETAGTFYNTYHFLQLHNLREIAKITGDELILSYVKRWSAYVTAWHNMPFYASSGASLCPYGTYYKDPPPPCAAPDRP